MRILIVEDSKTVVAALQSALQSEKMALTVAMTGLSGDSFLESARRFQRPYDVVLLDRGLPGLDGLEILRRLRLANDPTPVIMLTSQDSLDRRMEGFREGVDDYIVKPFEPLELVARLRAVTRRNHQGAVTPTTYTHRIGNLSFNETVGAFEIGGTIVRLPRKLQVILEALFNSKGHSVSKEFLTNLDAEGANEAAVDVSISRLRKRLKDALSSAEIETHYGIGYALKKSQE